MYLHTIMLVTSNVIAQCKVLTQGLKRILGQDNNSSTWSTTSDIYN